MNGLTVILAFAGILILFEEIVPRLRFAEWKRKQAKMLEAHKKHVEAAGGQPVAASVAAPDGDAAGGRAEPAHIPCGPRIPAWKVRLVKKARAGDGEAMAKLGNLAFQHHKLVEAYYWKWRLETTKKALVLNPSLRQLRHAWRKRGCPSERQNVYEGFDETQAAVIRAFLRLQCGIGTDEARERLAAFAGEGVEEAKWIVAHHDVRNGEDEKDDDESDA